jgi:hypothetical protein
MNTEKGFKDSGFVVTSVSSLCRDCEWRQRNPELYGKFYKELAHTTVNYKFNYPKMDEIKENFRFGSRGVYSVIVKDDKRLVFVTDVEPSSYYMPLIVSVCFAFTLWFGISVYHGVKQSRYETARTIQRSEDFMEDIIDLGTKKGRKNKKKKRKRRKSRDVYSSITGMMGNADSEMAGLSRGKTILTGFKREDNPNPELQQPTRIKFIDGFKGLVVTIYIITLLGGGNYRFFTPASWNLLTFSDLVFPGLLFITGVCTTLAFAHSQFPKKRWSLILARFVVFQSLGLIMSNKKNDFATLQFTGMFQTIAVAYFMISVLEMYFPIKYSTSRENKPMNLYYRIFFMAIFPIVNLVATFIYKNEQYDCPRGYQGPGGLAD